MITAWVRAARQTICGRCGDHIPEGAPMQVWTLERLSRGAEKLRCAHCADEAVPAVLPPPVVHVTLQPSLLTPRPRRLELTPVAALAGAALADYKRAQAKDGV